MEGHHEMIMVVHFKKPPKPRAGRTTWEDGFMGWVAKHNKRARRDKRRA